MSTLSNSLSWQKTEDELDTLNKCLVHLHSVQDIDKQIKDHLLTLVRDRCVIINHMRISLNQNHDTNQSSTSI